MQVVAALDASRAELRARSDEADGLREEYREMAQRLQTLQGTADKEKEMGEKHRIAALVLQSEVSRNPVLKGTDDCMHFK